MQNINVTITNKSQLKKKLCGPFLTERWAVLYISAGRFRPGLWAVLVISRVQ